MPKTSIYFKQFLSNDEGNHHCIGDYRDEKELFFYKNTTKTDVFIKRIKMVIQDDAIFKFNKYGTSIILENGINMYYMTSNKKRVDLTVAPIKTNTDFLINGFDVKNFNFVNGNRFVLVELNLDSETKITLNKDCMIVAEFNDDFHILKSQTIIIEGYTH